MAEQFAVGRRILERAERAVEPRYPHATDPTLHYTARGGFTDGYWARTRREDKAFLNPDIADAYAHGYDLGLLAALRRGVPLRWRYEATGGGCTAWVGERKDGSLVVITRAEDPSAPGDADEPAHAAEYETEDAWTAGVADEERDACFAVLLAVYGTRLEQLLGLVGA